MHLWRYSVGSGCWVCQRDVTEGTAKQWLALFKKDKPDCLFRVARSKPEGLTVAEDKKLLRMWKKQHGARTPAEERRVLREWQRGEGAV